MELFATLLLVKHFIHLLLLCSITHCFSPLKPHQSLHWRHTSSPSLPRNSHSKSIFMVIKVKAGGCGN